MSWRIALVIAAASVAAGLALSGCSGDGEEAAACEELSDRDRSTLVAVIGQADTFGVASKQFLESAVSEDVRRQQWLRASKDQLAVMTSAVVEQRRLVDSMESEALQGLLRPGITAYRQAVADLTAFRRAVQDADATAGQAAADQIDRSEQANRRQSEQFTSDLIRDFCNPPPLPERPS